jgi:hypothetical protein
VRPEGFGELIRFSYHIGSQTRDLPDCNIMPQPLRHRVSHYDNDLIFIIIYYSFGATALGEPWPP